MYFFERVDLVLNHHAMSRTELSRRLDIKHNTFSRYFTPDQQDKLSQSLWKMLDIFPDISRDWLFFGEGEMYNTDTVLPKREPFSCANHKDKLIGDMFHLVFDSIGLDEKTVSQKTKISKKRLEVLLSSSDYPTFEELESLYVNLQINPRYLFDGNVQYIYEPESHLERVYYALGLQGITPTYKKLEDIFGVLKDEAKEFLAEWNKFKEQGLDRTLPPDWLYKLEQRYSFNSSWIWNGSPPFMRERKQERDEKLYSELKDIQTENKDLLIENAALREQLAARTGQVQSATDSTSNNNEKSA